MTLRADQRELSQETKELGPAVVGSIFFFKKKKESRVT